VSTAHRLRAVWVVLFLSVCGVIAGFYFHLAGTNLYPSSKPYKVQAVIPTAVSLAPAADVRIAGVNVGRVSKITDSGDNTLVKMKLEDKYAPIYRDARVLVRAKSIAVENYVEIQPGTLKAGALPDDGVIPIGQSDEATQIDDVLGVLDSPRRRQLQQVLQSLAGALPRGGSDLNKTLEATAAVPHEGSPAVTVLDKQRSHVASLVDSLGRVAAALGERRDAIRLLTRQAKATAEAVATRDAKLRDMLAALPGFLHQAGKTGTRLTAFAPDATPVMRDLRLAIQDLVPAVNDLLPAARSGQKVVRELSRFSRAATPAVKQLPPFDAKGIALVPPLEGFLRQVNPLAAYLAPYSKEISTFFALNGATYGAVDQLGHVARIILPVSRSNAAGLFTAEQEQLLQQLSGPLDTRGSNAYPAPGTDGAPKPFTGTYPRLEREPPYTR
jgi:phospholipid/cholesterol/gamma-HCH transport system substrate-binding protein